MFPEDLIILHAGPALTQKSCDMGGMCSFNIYYFKIIT